MITNNERKDGGRGRVCTGGVPSLFKIFFQFSPNILYESKRRIDSISIKHRKVFTDHPRINTRRLGTGFTYDFRKIF